MSDRATDDGWDAEVGRRLAMHAASASGLLRRRCGSIGPSRLYAAIDESEPSEQFHLLGVLLEHTHAAPVLQARGPGLPVGGLACRGRLRRIHSGVPGPDRRRGAELKREARERAARLAKANPVEEYERPHNAVIAELQGNRNPLIDHPEWTTEIAWARLSRDSSGLSQA